MNPAFNRTLSLLVEIKTDHPTPDFGGRGDREERVQAGNARRRKDAMRKLNKFGKVASREVRVKLSNVQNRQPEKNIFQGAKPSHQRKSEPQSLPKKLKRPKKGFTDRLLDVLRRGAKKAKGFFKRKDEASKVVNYMPHVRRVVDTYKKDKRLRSRHSVVSLMHRRNL
jgi:hypothetical protein